MKPTYTLKTTAQTSSTTLSADTARILAPVMEAVAQTMSLADTKTAASKTAQPADKPA